MENKQDIALKLSKIEGKLNDAIKDINGLSQLIADLNLDFELGVLLDTILVYQENLRSIGLSAKLNFLLKNRSRKSIFGCHKPVVYVQGATMENCVIGRGDSLSHIDAPYLIEAQLVDTETTLINREPYIVLHGKDSVSEFSPPVPVYLKVVGAANQDKICYVVEIVENPVIEPQVKKRLTLGSITEMIKEMESKFDELPVIEVNNGFVIKPFKEQ